MSKSIGRAVLNSVLQTGNAFFHSGFNFLVIIALTHFLGPEGFGSYVSSQAKVAVWVLLVDLGLLSGAISTLTALRIQGSENGTAPVLWRILLIRFVGASIGVALIAFFSHGTLSFNQDLAFAPYLYGYGLQVTLNTYFLYRQQQGWCVLTNMIGLIATSVIAISCAYNHRSVSHVLFVQSLAPFVSSVFLLFGLPFAHKTMSKPQPLKVWSTLAMNSWPYALIFASTTLWQRLDQLVAAHSFGLAEVGEYGLAVRLAGIPILMTSAVSLALFPDFQRVGVDAPEKLHFYVGLMLKVLLRYGIFLAALVLISMAFALAWIFPKFTVALHLIPWFIPGIWGFWMFNFANNALLGLRSHKSAVLAHLGGVLLYVGALFVLPKLFGLPGIALAYDLFCIALFLFTYAGLRGANRNGVALPWIPLSGEEKAAFLSALKAGLRLKKA